MPKILRVSVNTGFVGATRTEECEIEDNLSESEIEELATDMKNNMVEWSFSVEEK